MLLYFSRNIDRQDINNNQTQFIQISIYSNKSLIIATSQVHNPSYNQITSKSHSVEQSENTCIRDISYCSNPPPSPVPNPPHPFPLRSASLSSRLSHTVHYYFYSFLYCNVVGRLLSCHFYLIF